VNILPLVFTFLIIFLCIASTFLREVKSFDLVETVLNSFNRTERQLNNTIASKAYRKMKGKAINKKDTGSTQTKKRTYTSRRSFFPPFENSKFNLEPLIKYEGEFKLHPLFEPLAEMLRLLYKKTIFDRHPHLEKIEYRLLDAIIIKARKHPEAEDLSELFPDDPELRSIYYKMLKGTNQYNEKKGIPSFGDFASLRKKTPALFFCFASPPLLEALFNHEIATHILQEEQKKREESNTYHYFPKEDLQILLMKNPTLSSRYSTLEPYIDHTQQMEPRREIGGIDRTTGLSVKKPLH
jgi:hypothetical protein